MSLISGGYINPKDRQANHGRGSGGGPVGLLGNVLAAGRDRSDSNGTGSYSHPFAHHSGYYGGDYRETSRKGYDQTLQQEFSREASTHHGTTTPYSRYDFSNPAAPYGQQSSNPPAPYGISNFPGPYDSSVPPAPYGELYYNTPAARGNRNSNHRRHDRERGERSGPLPIAAVKRRLQPVSLVEAEASICPY